MLVSSKVGKQKSQFPIDLIEYKLPLCSKTLFIAFIWNRNVCVVTKVARLFLAPTSRLETLWRHISISSVDTDRNPSSQEALFCWFSWVPSNKAYLTYGIPDAGEERNCRTGKLETHCSVVLCWKRFSLKSPFNLNISSVIQPIIKSHLKCFCNFWEPRSSALFTYRFK